ncbi:hypothetical protein ATER59S_04358 [Aquamicrobium terrae]
MASLMDGDAMPQRRRSVGLPPEMRDAGTSTLAGNKRASNPQDRLLAFPAVLA